MSEYNIIGETDGCSLKMRNRGICIKVKEDFLCKLNATKSDPPLISKFS